MLTPARAKAELERQRDPGDSARRLADAGRLPARAGAIARLLLCGDETGRRRIEPSRRCAAAEDAVGRLDALDADGRRLAFRAVFGDLTPWVEGAWAILRAGPYPVGFTRKAFRAPDRPDLTRRRRARWLEALRLETAGLPADPVWLAAWAPHLCADAPAGVGEPDAVSPLLAAAIDAGGPVGTAVFDTLLASARGEHETGAMGRHVLRALLLASRRDGWEFVERLLQSARRQEGLRQAILESADEAHPDAFRLLLDSIVEHGFARFSATVRAADTWLGLRWEAAAFGTVHRTLERVAALLDDPDARAAALAGGDPEPTYLALWSMAFRDAPAAVPAAAALLGNPDPRLRFAAAHLLGQLGVAEARAALRPALADPDLRVASRALAGFEADTAPADDDLYERLVRLRCRLPARPGSAPPLVWPWGGGLASAGAVLAILTRTLGRRSPDLLLAHRKQMDAPTRALLAGTLGLTRTLTPEGRAALFALAGDPSPGVRGHALRALAGRPPTPAEARALEARLNATSGSMRGAVLGLLAGQEDPEALHSAARLLGDGSPARRAAGLELLRLLAESGRDPEGCRRLVARHRRESAPLAPTEEKQIDAILARAPVPPSSRDAFGLLDPEGRAPVPEPAADRVRLATEAAVSFLESLDRWTHARRHVSVLHPGLLEPVPLGSLAETPRSPATPVRPAADDSAAIERELCAWFDGRADELRDPDGLEIVRAARLLRHRMRARPQRDRDALAAHYRTTGRPPRIRYPEPVRHLLEALLRLRPVPGADGFHLDLLETFLADLCPSPAALARSLDDEGSALHDVLAAVAPPAAGRAAHRDTAAFATRRFGLLRRLETAAAALPDRGGRAADPLPLFPETRNPRRRRFVDPEATLAAWEAGAATDHDLIDLWLGPRDPLAGGWHAWQQATRRPGSGAPGAAAHSTRLANLIDRCRRRVLEIELERGETPTAATPAVLVLPHTGGVDVLLRTLRLLAPDPLPRPSAAPDASRASVWMHVLVRTWPRETDTPAAFAAAARAECFPDARLVELSLAAPQWMDHAERALGWEGFADAAGWVLAHAGAAWETPDPADRALQRARMAGRTSLSIADLRDGAVDTAWFRRAHAALGAERWQVLMNAARYASASAGHKRAQQYADALLGRVSVAALTRRIAERRHADSVRALGLVPLATDPAGSADRLARWRTIREFLRTSRPFGSRRRESERRAGMIALENLARTAGFPDALRLEWAQEAESVADLAAGPLEVKTGEVEVTLALDAEARASFTAAVRGRAVKGLPAAARRDPRVAELLRRKADLQRQTARIRAALEESMVRGDTFDGTELRTLLSCPVFGSPLERLVLVGEGALGYPIHAGRALVDAQGRTAPVGAGDRLRIAHPLDLLAARTWTDWQRDCFARERVQPFKQVFRELYPLTASERAAGLRSLRYAGHQVEPRRALALLGGRGWITDPDLGVRRSFPVEGIVAWLGFAQAFCTPADVEGLTLEAVGFARRTDGVAIPPAEVPPRLFSEVMRDLDLVVAVAHRGGVDPEATASTVEMRAALLRETCALLRLDNVEVRPPHARVRGALADYTVHLGSAVAHRLPGGMLNLVAVHGQHRGRLFLPFRDDDPRTAEVLSKAILLARDEEIRDPNLLVQIRAE